MRRVDRIRPATSIASASHGVLADYRQALHGLLVGARIEDEVVRPHLGARGRIALLGVEQLDLVGTRLRARRQQKNTQLHQASRRAGATSDTCGFP